MVGPLAPDAEPHSWDLCDQHATRITAPLGWEMLRVDHIELDEDEDLTALAEAVREAGRVTSGLVESAGEDPIENPDTRHDAADPGSSDHPVFRTKRIAADNASRRAHLHVVQDSQAESQAD